MCTCAFPLRQSQVFITHFCFPFIAASGFILLRFFSSSCSWLCLRLALGAQSWTQPFDYLICVCSCVACFHTGWLNVSQRNLHIQSIKHPQWKAFWSTLKQLQCMIIFSSAGMVTLKTAAQWTSCQGEFTFSAGGSSPFSNSSRTQWVKKQELEESPFEGGGWCHTLSGLGSEAFSPWKRYLMKPVYVFWCVCEWRRPVFIQAVLEWPAQRRHWGQRVSAYLPLQPRSLFRTERGQSRSEFQSPNVAYCTLVLANSTRYRRCLEVGEYVRVLYTRPDHHDQRD